MKIDFGLFDDYHILYKLFVSKTNNRIKQLSDFIIFLLQLTSGASNQHCRSTNDQDICISKAFSLFVLQSTVNCTKLK